MQNVHHADAQSNGGLRFKKSMNRAGTTVCFHDSSADGILSDHV